MPKPPHTAAPRVNRQPNLTSRIPIGERRSLVFISERSIGAGASAAGTVFCHSLGVRRKGFNRRSSTGFFTCLLLGLVVQATRLSAFAPTAGVCELVTHCYPDCQCTVTSMNG